MREEYDAFVAFLVVLAVIVLAVLLGLLPLHADNIGSTEPNRKEGRHASHP